VCLRDVEGSTPDGPTIPGATPGGLALGELVGAAKEGLLALSVGVGLGVMAELMQEEVTEVVGPEGKHDPARTAVRHGREAGEVTLGGGGVAVERPRAHGRRQRGGGACDLPSLRRRAIRSPDWCSSRCSPASPRRRFQRTREPVGEDVEAEARSTSKSAVSRESVARMRENLDALLSRRLDDVRLAVMMIDGIELKGRTNVGTRRGLAPPIQAGDRRAIHCLPSTTTEEGHRAFGRWWRQDRQTAAVRWRRWLDRAVSFEPANSVPLQETCQPTCSRRIVHIGLVHLTSGQQPATSQEPPCQCWISFATRSSASPSG
jgi:hypothetical protein